MNELAAKELKSTEIKGFSKHQIEEHHGILYKGYINKVNEIRTKLQDVNYGKANQTFSDLRAMKIEETFALNGIKLHEAYFDNMGGQGAWRMAESWI